MKCELQINGHDARVKWGIVLADGAIAALMTPPPMKEYILNESATVSGKILANAPSAMPKTDSRDLQLTFHIIASSRAELFAKYDSFVKELEKGLLKVKTRYQEDITYKLLYQSCSLFSDFNGRLAKFVLRLTEPNPSDRNDND